jgi:hypothetical protein
MFSWRIYTDGARGFVLLIAISIMLLVTVSAAPARSVQAPPLLVGLERDLAALRAQLEVVPMRALGPYRSEDASNTGIADGGAAFRWEAIATIMRGANRRAGALKAQHRDPGAAATARMDALRFDLRTLEHRLARLRSASSEAETVEAQIQTEQTLATLERALADLHRPRLN